VLQISRSCNYTFKHRIFIPQTPKLHLTNSGKCAEVNEERFHFLLNMCFVWPLNVRQEYRLTAFEKLAMWKLFGPKKEGCNMRLGVTVFGVLLFILFIWSLF
jgi:hypothetical protein